MSNFAQIQSGVIINIVVADAEDYFDPSFTWTDITAYNPQPQQGWTTSDGVTFASPIAEETLSQAIAQNIASFQSAIQSFIDAKYPLDIRFNFIALYVTAQNAGNLPNRMAYIAQLFTWANSVTAYSAAYIAQVKAMTNVTTINATEPDFTQISVPDPLINPIVAIGINN